MIEIRELTKAYNKTVVLDHVSVTFETGKIYGLIGRNGSGKTMLMKSILGFVYPDEGEVLVDGKKTGKDKDVPGNVGAIIETPGFLLDSTAYQNLKYLAMIQNKVTDDQIRKVLDQVGLNADDKKKVRAFSLGMRQRLGLAQALMETPSILLLDEPMNGLDDQGVEDMRRILLEYKTSDRIIIVASHSKEDIELLCDEVYRMSRGKIENNTEK